MKSIIAANHSPIPPELETLMKDRMKSTQFPTFLGLILEEVRRDYARMRLPYRPELDQAAGLVHAGAIVSLIDSVVVTAILSGINQVPDRLLTIDLHTHFLAGVAKEDCIAEAEVRHRGRKIVFLNVEVSTPSGILVADSSLSYKVVYPR